MTVCPTQLTFDFHPRKAIIADFKGGLISSDAGPGAPGDPEAASAAACGLSYTSKTCDWFPSLASGLRQNNIARPHDLVLSPNHAYAGPRSTSRRQSDASCRPNPTQILQLMLLHE